MRASDPALDYPCEDCKAAVGMPCTFSTHPRAGLVERAVPHQSRRAAAVARGASDILEDGPPAHLLVDVDAPRGGAGGGPFDVPTTYTPHTPSADVDRTGPPAAASASPQFLPVVELACGHPASGAQAYKALNQPDAPELFCFICAKYVERAS